MSRRPALIVPAISAGVIVLIIEIPAIDRHHDDRQHFIGRSKSKAQSFDALMRIDAQRASSGPQ